MKKVKAGIIAFTPLLVLAGANINSEQYIASQTGGEVVHVHRPEDYGAGLEKIIGDLTSRYSLGFVLDEREPDDGRMHKIEVRVKARDSRGRESKLEAFAQRAYYHTQKPTIQKEPLTKKQGFSK
jgi:hypothetical protein